MVYTLTVVLASCGKGARPHDTSERSIEKVCRPALGGCDSPHGYGSPPAERTPVPRLVAAIVGTSVSKRVLMSTVAVVLCIGLVTVTYASRFVEPSNVHDRSSIGHGTEANAPPEPRPAGTQRVVVVGHTSVISVHRSWWPEWIRGPAEPIVTDFLIYPLGKVAFDVQVTTSGLGHVPLWSREPSEDCGQPNGSDRHVLLIEPLDRELRICAAIPPPDLSTGQGPLKGKFIVINPVGHTVEVGIDLLVPARHAFWTGFAWFFGLLVPAAITALVGYLATLASKPAFQRLDERIRFEKFKWEKTEDITAFFTSVYPRVKAESDEIFAVEINNDLRDRGILNFIPGPRRAELERALKDQDREVIDTLLKRLFPRYKGSIGK